MQTLFSNLQKWMAAIIIFLFPLFLLPTTQEFYITNKFYLLAFGVLTILGLAAINLLFSRKITLAKSPFDKVLVMLLITRAISIIFSSPNKFEALISLPSGLAPMLVLTLLYFILTSQSENDSPLTISSIILGIITIIFFFNPFAGVQLPTEFSFLSNPRFSPLGNRLDLIFFLGFFLIYQGGTAYKYIKSKKPYILNALYSILFVIALALVLFSVFKPHDNTQTGIQLPPINISWVAAVETLKAPQTAVFGVGPGNFASLFTLVKPVSYNQTDLWQLNFIQSRSSLLQLWTETGLLGLLVFLIIVVTTIRELGWLKSKGDKDATRLMLLSAYIGLVFLAFPSSFITFFLLIILLVQISHRVAAHEKNTGVQTTDLSQLAPIYLTMSLITLALVGGLCYLAGRAYASEYYFKKSLNAVQTNKAQDVYNSQLEAIRLNPYNEAYRLRFVQVNLILANNLAQKEEITDADRQTIAQFIQQAIGESKQVVQLNPQKALNWSNLASTYRSVINIVQGAEAWSIASYQRAILFDPSNPLLRLNLGGVFYSLENYNEAIRSFEQAVALKPDWANAHYNLAWAQFQNKDFERAILTMQNVLTLVDSESEDYKQVQLNLETFKQALEDQRPTEEGVESDLNPEGLTLPTPPNVQLSPPIKLPEKSGPNDQLKAQPTPAGAEETQEETQQETPETTPVPTQAQ